MRRPAILLLIVLPGCKPAERATAEHETPATALPDNRGSEKPVWAFGEGSVRTDPLPAQLDSLTEWGEYYDGASPVAYTTDVNGDGRPEWLVRGAASLCGRAGCPTRLITRTADGHFVDVLDDS